MPCYDCPRFYGFAFHALPQVQLFHCRVCAQQRAALLPVETNRLLISAVSSLVSQALQLLNSLGYGQPGSGLTLDLVYNPGGAFLAPDQAKLQARFFSYCNSII